MGIGVGLRRFTGSERALSQRGVGAVVAGLMIALLFFEKSVIPGVSASFSDFKTAAQRRKVQIQIHDFALTDQNGRQFRFQSTLGKVVLVTFGYTTCPDVCPLTTAAMREVQANLASGERDAVFLITVTTDPEVDEPKLLATYAKRFSADLSNWSFLTGSERTLGEVWKNFGVKVQRKARGLVDHTPLTAVIDQDGAMRLAYHGSAPDPKMMLRDVRSLLDRRY